MKLRVPPAWKEVVSNTGSVKYAVNPAGTHVSGECDNVTFISSQVDLMLAEYDRGVGHAGAVEVSASLEVQHASIDDRDSTIRMLASLLLVSDFFFTFTLYPAYSRKGGEAQFALCFLLFAYFSTRCG